MLLFRRILDWLAPVVCDACEGGCGLLYDARTRTARVCPSCLGTGRGWPEPAGAVVQEPLAISAKKTASDRRAA